MHTQRFSQWLPAVLLLALIGGIPRLAAQTTGAETAPAAAPRAPVLSGCEPDYPPYCLVTQDQQADGFAVELLRAALKALGREVVFQVGPWAELKQSLADGRLQALPLVGRTPEREALYDFTFPYLTMHGAIVVRSETTDIRVPADLKGKQVAVLQGDNAEEYLRRADLGAVIMPLPSFETALRELSAGQHDAVVIQKLLAYQLMQQAGLENLRVAGPPLQDFIQTFCFAVRKGDGALLAELNEGLAIVMADGTFRQLHAKWFSAIEAAGRTSSRVIIGGDYNYPPYEFLDQNGQPTGFNVDLVRAIARQLGLTVDFRLDTWLNTRKGLKSGEIDMVQGMFYSVERDGELDFSPPHSMVQHAVVVRKGAPELPDLRALAGKSILVMAGDIMEDLAIRQGYQRQLVAVPSQEEALRLLADGKHDCALVATVPALYWINKHGWRNLRVGAQPVLSAEYCLAVPHGKDTLLAQFCEGLAAIKASGEYRRIQTKWLGAYEVATLSIRTIAAYVLMAALPLLALLGGVILWSRSLQRQVASRTREIALESAILEAQSEATLDGAFLVDPQGRTISYNKRFAQLLNVPPDILVSKDTRHLLTFILDQLPEPQGFEDKVKYLYEHKEEQVHEEVAFKDGRVFDWHSAPLLGTDGTHYGRGWYFHDISQRKQAEAYQEMGREVLQILNELGPLKDLMQRVLVAMQTHTGFAAVGIRLQDGDDFPYFAQTGFPEDFLLTENTLVARDAKGVVCRDKDGNVRLACTCGLVIMGQTDPANPLFTQGGSFWTNDPFSSHDFPADQDPRLHPRNQCMHQGYTSFALVPIRTKDQIVGLLQLSDHREGCFSLVAIEQLEGIAAHIGEMLMRKQAEEQVRVLLEESTQARLTLLGILEDQTRTEADLKRLATAIEQAAEVVVVMDVRGLIQYVNPAFEAVTGYTRAESIGQDPRMLLESGQQDEAFFRTLWETISSGKTWQGRFVNRRKNGAFYTEEATISPVRDATGRIANYVAVKRDITEDLSLQAQLTQAQKMESAGRLAGGVAHDFNNILQTILGNAELAAARTDPADPIRADLEEIQGASRRAADLTRQLLAFASKQTIAPRTLNLNDAVEGMLKMLRRLIAENIELVWAPHVGLWPIRMDPSQIDQILANLSVNARDAIDGIGAVHIATENTRMDELQAAQHDGLLPGDYVMLTVSDTGCGMDKETLNKIFEPFYTTKATGKGTGLGLATVYGIVRQNHGHIGVYSEPGHGTTFRIHLPRDMDADATHLEQRSAPPAARGCETVLLVEDDAAILNMSSRMLRELGYTVLAAGAPEAALHIAQEHTGELQLLVTDVIMPGMNGRALAERLQARYPQLKCMFMSGYAASVITHHGVLEQGFHFLAKPFSRDELARKVREVLEQA